MTPYERSKVLDTYLRLQREEGRGEAHKLSKDAKTQPHRISQDLSMCISVGEIKPSANPYVKLMEKRFGNLKNKASSPSTIKFDRDTLRDPH